MTENFKIVQTTELNQQVKQQVFDLWNNEYPEKLAYSSITELDDYLQSLINLQHFLLIHNPGLILGWAITFERDNEKWFAIILSDKVQGKGLGRLMLDELKHRETILNGWVIDHNLDIKKNGLIYRSPLNFYQKCGFEVQADIRLELEKISAVKIQWTSRKKG